VLPIYRYEGIDPLLATLVEKVIAPAEEKAKALEERRRMFEAELASIGLRRFIGIQSAQQDRWGYRKAERLGGLQGANFISASS
jgi:hypothetical protein